MKYIWYSPKKSKFSFYFIQHTGIFQITRQAVDLLPSSNFCFLSEKHAQNLLMAEFDVLCSEPKKRGNSYKKIFMEVIEHGMIG